MRDPSAEAAATAAAGRGVSVPTRSPCNRGPPIRSRPAEASPAIPTSSSAGPTRVRVVGAAARPRAARANETGTPEGPSVAELLAPARIALHFGHRFRRRRLAGAVAQLELPPADVAPPAQLVTDGSVHADRPETERLVQPHAGGVRQGDACVRRVEPLQPQQPEQLAVEVLSD